MDPSGKITTSMLEDVRKRLRSFVKLIEKTKRPIIYPDLTDSMGEEADVHRRASILDMIIRKLRSNERRSPEDLDALEKTQALRNRVQTTPSRNCPI